MGAVNDLITTFVGNKLIELLKSGTNRIADEISHVANNKILEYLCVEYERNCKTKTILHRSEPIELEKFYQPLCLAKAVDRWRQLSSSHSRRIKTDKINNLFVKGNCVTIIGTAGSGKSTLVKYLFVNAIKNDFKIPIKVELRYINDYSGNLISYIWNEVIKFLEIAKSDQIIDKLLQAGKFVFFFDGYDEVSSNKKEEVTKDICKITKKYPSNYYILTSRPFVNIDMIDDFINYYVCDLSDEEIKSFVKKQFPQSEQELANKIIQTINEEGSSAYRSFLSNPLLLSMFIVTYQTDSNIPQKRSDYYYQVFNTLYSVHDTSSKLGFVREKKSGLKKEEFIELLKRFSFKSFFNQKYSFPMNYFENQVAKIKKDLHFVFKIEDLIFDLEVAIGILTQEGVEITFPHRSLQEYFAALFVTSLSIKNKEKLYDEFLLSHFERMIMERIYDNSNFFFLLFEMDNIDVKKRLVIPLLKKIMSIEKKTNMDTEIIELFISLHSISRFLREETQTIFCQENDKYNKQFEKYYNEEKKQLGGNDKGIKQKQVEQIRNKALNRLAFNDIKPFLDTYDIPKEIRSITSSLNALEKMDSSFIDSLSDE